MYSNQTIMNNLKQILQDKGISQVWLAEKLGVKPLTVNRWCQNYNEPKLCDVAKICELLDIEVKELVQP